MRFRIGYALLCCSAICCVAQLIDHLHLAWLCNCVCCIQGTPEGNNSKKRRLAWMAKSLMAAGVDVKFPDEE